MNSSTFKQYQLGSHIKIMPFNGSAADLIRVDREKISVYQEKLYEEVFYIGNYMNPSIVKWNNRYLMGNSMTWGVFEGKRQAQGRMVFRWLNLSSASYQSTEPYLCITSGNYSKQIGYVASGKEYHLMTAFKLEDPRLMVMNSTWIHIVFTIMSPKHITLANADLHLKEGGNCAKLYDFHMLRYEKEVKKTQKNWSPFVYQNRILYVQSINPMNVIDYAGYNSTYLKVTFDVMHDVSHSPYHPNISWSYGNDLRGGSNCLLINEHEYFSFFHSYRYSNLTDSKTYVMGAYTFSSKPPFRLLRITSYPIMLDDNFYTGPIHVKNDQWSIDYVVFPMTISFLNDDPTNDQILLSFGHQDRHGYLARFKLSKLLDAMEHVRWPAKLLPYYDTCQVQLQDYYRTPSRKKVFFKPYYFCSNLR
jgi:predicted GH43/DUF377 family glycosyl hydrolase